jgi:hypothetical protein
MTSLFQRLAQFIYRRYWRPWRAPVGNCDKGLAFFFGIHCLSSKTVLFRSIITICSKLLRPFLERIGTRSWNRVSNIHSSTAFEASLVSRSFWCSFAKTAEWNMVSSIGQCTDSCILALWTRPTWCRVSRFASRASIRSWWSSLQSVPECASVCRENPKRCIMYRADRHFSNAFTILRLARSIVGLCRLCHQLFWWLCLNDSMALTRPDGTGACNWRSGHALSCVYRWRQQISDFSRCDYEVIQPNGGTWSAVDGRICRCWLWKHLWNRWVTGALVLCLGLQSGGYTG